MAGYQFRAMAGDDLPLVRTWLTRPHVREWWGDPREQFELVRDDLDDPAMEQFIVATADRPFAYLQCYEPAMWPQGGLGEHPDGTRGVDQFIGEAHMIGRGHGSAFIRLFAEALLQTGAPRIVTDPDPENGRAVRAYEKAGFLKDRLVDTPDGPSLLMVRDA
jgi:aminoglycoside 6'-N-acetyltransferase